MSDTEVIEKKRGRPSTAKNEDASEKVDLKKRPRESTPPKKQTATENGSTPAKRGRGRPKGTKKAGGKLRKPPVPGRGRGRPKVNNDPPKNESATDETEEDEEQESASDS